MLGLFGKLGQSKTTPESKSAETLLELGIEVELAGRTFSAPRPTLAVWLELSRLASELSGGDTPEEVTMLGMLERGRDVAVYAGMLSALLVGIKRQGKSDGERRELEAWMLERCTVSEVSTALLRLLEACQVGELFMLTTSLRGLSITTPTRREEGVVKPATALGL